MPGVIITGGTSGIGRACVDAFAANGWDVGFTWRRDRNGAAAALRAAAVHGSFCAARQVDHADPEATARAIDELLDAVPGVTTLVNNAGIDRNVAVLDEEPEGWRHLLDVNLLAPLVALRTAARRWIADGTAGRIVNLTSMLDRQPARGAAAYGASKAALRSLTTVAALELAPHGITVIGVAPGEVVTPMNFGPGVAPDLEVARPEIPLGRCLSADEVGEAIRALTGPAFRSLTGEVVLLDGGLTLRSGADTMMKEIGRG